MTWSVETLGAQVDAEIVALPKDMQAAFLRLSERIEWARHNPLLLVSKMRDTCQRSD